jgi:hypothetical protein
MGGVVTRAYLLKYRDIAEKTAFAYFSSTPTTGSQAASIARLAFNSPQIEELKLMGAKDYLANLMTSWVAAHFSFASYCAYENKPTDGIMLVVSMASAVALCDGALDPIDADHGGNCKARKPKLTIICRFQKRIHHGTIRVVAKNDAQPGYCAGRFVSQQYRNYIKQ